MGFYIVSIALLNMAFGFALAVYLAGVLSEGANPLA